MNIEKSVTKDIFYVGGSDRRISLFENLYPVPDGMSYNAYVIVDEKTALIDAVDQSIGKQFVQNVVNVLGGRQLDFLVVNHMEPDHSATIADIIAIFPNVSLVMNAKTKIMFDNFFVGTKANIVLVKENDELSLGQHVLTFVMAPMVHWPEVMVTYDKTAKVLFSADAFGCFGALDGNICAETYDIEGKYLSECRRYYSNIVGKYGSAVQMLLKKLANVEVKFICPLHGGVLTTAIEFFLEKYAKWSKYESESDGVLIVYSSIYGNTENAANILASKIADKNIKDIRVYDASKTDVSYLVGETFRCKNIIVASPTYNANIFPKVKEFLDAICEKGIQNRNFAIVQNGSWAPVSAKLIKDILDKQKNIAVQEEILTIVSTLKDSQLQEIDNFVDIFASKI
ncbi:MAG: FprA family A-type flavoprotein [Clostridia bacterium]